MKLALLGALPALAAPTSPTRKLGIAEAAYHIAQPRKKSGTSSCTLCGRVISANKAGCKRCVDMVIDCLTPESQEEVKALLEISNG